MDWNPTTNNDAAAIMHWLNRSAEECHRVASEHGWWDQYDRSVPEQLMLMVSELSEALEEIRKNPDPRLAYYHEDGKLEGFGAELVDCIIRILDTCERYDIDVGALFLEKMAFNEQREYRHGGKSA